MKTSWILVAAFLATSVAPASAAVVGTGAMVGPMHAGTPYVQSDTLISRQTAEQIALNAVGGGTVTSSQLYRRMKPPYWLVQIAQRLGPCPPGWRGPGVFGYFKVTVNARNGSVLDITETKRNECAR